jgi:hypothetical protein
MILSVIGGYGGYYVIGFKCNTSEKYFEEQKEMK